MPASPEGGAPLPPEPEVVVVVRIVMLSWASCCSFGTSKLPLGGVTLSGNARSTRQRWPGPFTAPAVDDGVQSKVVSPPAAVATGCDPVMARVRKRRLPGSIRTVPLDGLSTRLGSPT